MRTRTMLTLLALAFATPAFAQAVMGPAEAVTAAKAGDVEGVFEFTVASAGAGGFSAYLNSAADYHDPGNLTIELHAAAINALKARYGGYPEDVLKGKRVRVKGVARRLPVGKNFQTRIVVDAIGQIEILN